MLDLLLIKSNQEIDEMLEEFNVAKVDRMALKNSLDIERIKRSELNLIIILEDNNNVQLEGGGPSIIGPNVIGNLSPVPTMNIDKSLQALMNRNRNNNNNDDNGDHCFPC